MRKCNPLGYRFFLLLVLIGFILITPISYAISGTPTIISYQGRLTDLSGNLLGDSGTTYYFKFSIWDNATVGSGNRLWPANVPATTTATVRQGVFNVNIGDTANGYPDPLNYNFNTNAAVYLQVEVSSDNNFSETLSPRQRIAAAAFAQISGAVSGTSTPSTFGTTTPIGNSVVTIEASSTNAIPLSIRAALNQLVNLFQIQDSTGSNLLFVNQAGGLFASSTFQATGAAKFYSILTTEGSIGVGTTSPSQALSVQGNALISGTTTVANLVATGTIQAASLSLTGNLNISGSQTLTGLTIMTGGFISSASSSIAVQLNVAGPLSASSTLNVAGLANLSGFISSASSTVSANLQVAGPLSASSTLSVANTSYLQTLGLGTTSPSQLLSVQGNALISGDLTLANLIATGTLNVTGLTTSGNFLTTGWLHATSSLIDTLTVAGTLTTTNLSATGTASITGLSTLTGGFISSASSSIAAQLNVSGPLSASSTLNVAGLSSLTGFISSASSTVAANLNVAGPLSASSTLNVAGTSYLQTLGLGTTSPSKLLSVHGSALFSGNVSLANLVATGTLSVSGHSSLTTASTTMLTMSNGFISSASSTISSTLDVGGVMLPALFTAKQDPTGFVDRVAVLSWDDTTYTFTITGNHDVYINGVKRTMPTASKQIADTTGTHWIYYDSNFAIQESTSVPSFSLPLIATVYWNTSTNGGLLGNERHGIKMDVDTHTLLHYTVGTRYESGLTGSFADTTFTMTTGIIDDEDVAYSLPATTTVNVLYKNGSANFEWLTGQTKYYTATGTLQYNSTNNLVDVANGQYVCYWIFASNATNTSPIISLTGQSAEANLNDARNNCKYESLTLGTLPFQEMKILYRVILRNVGGTPTYVEAQDLRSISNLPAGTFVATQHGALTGLNWSVAGHTFDTDLNIGAYGFLNTKNILTTGGIYASSTSIFNGSLGIGTTTPARKLAVEGSALISGDLTVANIIATGTMTVTGGQTYTGLATFASGFISSASSSIAAQLNVAGPLSASSTLNVAGLANLSGFISSASSTISSNLLVSGVFNASSSASINGPLALTGTTGTSTIASGQGLTVGGSQLVIIGSNGNVGIGTAGPTNNLTIGVAAGKNNFVQGVSFVDANNQYPAGINYGSAGGAISGWGLDFFAPTGASATATILSLRANGNVGIGTTSPSQLLSVHGSALISGDLTLANLIATGTLNITGLTTSGNFLTTGWLHATSSLIDTATVAGTLTTTNLSATGTASVTGLSTLTGGFISSASSSVAAQLNVAGPLSASSTLSVGNTSYLQTLGLGTTSPSQLLSVHGSALISGDLTVANIIATGTFTVTGTTNYTGLATFAGGFISSASSSIAAQLNVAGPLSASSTLNVAGLANLSGFISSASSTVAANLQVAGPLSASSTLSVAGLSSLAGFISNASSTVSSSLNVGGNLLASSTLQATGNALFYGNLGIGSTTPYARLAVKATAGSATPLVQVASSSDDIYFEISSTGTTTIEQLQTGAMTFDTNAGRVSWIDMPVTSAAAYGTIMGYSAMIDASSTLAVLADSDGLGGIANQRIGIATSSPAGTLAVSAGTTTPALYVYQGGTGDLLLLQNTNSAFFNVKNSGLVGLGTTSPSQLLSVQGNALISGDLTVANIIATGTMTVTGGQTYTGLATFASGFISSASSSVAAQLNVAGPLSASSTLSVANTSYLQTLGLGTTSPSQLLSVHGSALISGDLTLANLIATGTLNITGLTTSGNFLTTGWLHATSSLIDTATVAGTLTTTNLSATGTASVTGLSTLTGGFISSASSSVAAQLNVAGPLSASSTLNVAGLANLSGFISSASSTISSNLLVSGVFNASSSASINGPLALTGTTGTSTIASGQGLTVGGSQLVIIGSNGKVGIGTTTPQASLHLDTSLDGGIIINQLGGTNQGRVSFYNGGVAKYAIGHRSVDNTFRIAEGDALHANVRLVILPTSGNIGIATTSPSQLLSVQGNALISGDLTVANITATGTFTVTGTTNYTGLATFAGGFISSASSSVAAQLNVAGPLSASSTLSVANTSYLQTLGLGTTSPSQLLSVHGSALISGDLTLANLIATGTLNITGLTTSGNFLTTGWLHATSSLIDTATVAGTLTTTNLSATGTASVTGLSTLTGGFISSASSSVAAQLNVAGPLSASSTLSVGSGTSTITGSLDMGFLDADRLYVSGSATSTLTNGLFIPGGTLQVSLLNKTNCDLKADANGNFYCGTDATTAGADDFSFSDNYGVINAATSSPLWAKGAVYASSTLLVQGLTTSGNFLTTGWLHATSSLIDTATVAGTLTTTNLSATGTASITGLSTLTGGFISSASSSVAAQLNVAGPLSASSTLNVAGTSYLQTLGLGTTSPSRLLSVQGSALFSGDLTLANLIATGTASTTNLYVSTNLGIGTSTPTRPLSVQGSALISGNLTLANLIATGTLNVAGKTTLGAATTTQLTASSYFQAGGNRGLTVLGGINFINVSTGSDLLSTPGDITVSHTVQSGDNRLLLVKISINTVNSDAGGSQWASSTAVTYGGTALTFKTGLQVQAAYNDVEIWYMVNPPVGTANVVASILFNSDPAYTAAVVVGVESYTGVDQTNPFGTPATASGTSGTATVNVTSQTGDLVTDVVSSRYNQDMILGDSQIKMYFIDQAGAVAGGDCQGAGSYESGKASVTMSWKDVSSDIGEEWTIAAVPLKPANGGLYAGHVGVGTSTPLLAKFTLAGDGTEGLTTAFAIKDSSGVEKVTILDSGLLGLGSTTPYARLSIKAGAGDATRLFSVASSSNDTYFEINSAGTTTIEQLQTGVMTFETNAGQVTWIDMPVNSGASLGTMMGYHAMIDANSVLVVSAESDGAGGIQNRGVSVYGDETSYPLLTVTSTSTGELDYARVGIGTTSPWGGAGLRDQLTVSGRINSTWSYLQCEAAGVSNLGTAATADTVASGALCGDFGFDLSATADSRAIYQTQGYPGFIRLDSGYTTSLATGEGGTIRTYGRIAPATSTPVMEARVRIPLTTAKARFLVGFTDEAWGDNPTKEPVNGAYFTASSSESASYWVANVRNENTETNVTTTVATSTTSWYRMRIEVTSTEATFLIDGQVVAVITTTMPDDNLTPMVQDAFSCSAACTAAVNFIDVAYIRVWIDDPPGGVVGGVSSGFAQPEGPLFDPVQGADIAESYLKNADEFKEGMIVSNIDGNVGMAGLADEPYDKDILGIVSTSPHTVLGQETSSTTRIALIGRVPVLVSLANGPIHRGDRITSSADLGIGMKANRAGYIIGKALEGFDPENGIGTCQNNFADSSVGGPAAGNQCIGTILAQVHASSDMGIGDVVQEVGQTATDIAAAIADLANDAFSKGAELVKLVVGKLVAQVAVVKDLFANTLSILPGGDIKVPAGDNQIVGDATFPSGATSILVLNSKTTPASKVFITPKVTVAVPLVVTEIREGSGFVVSMASPAPIDIPFSWMLISSYKANETSGGAVILDSGPVTSPDIESPVITLNGFNPIEIEVGTSWSDPGATVTDNVNDNLGIYYKIDGVETGNGGRELPRIDTSIAGEHTIIYTATDQTGNTGTAERAVRVIAPAPIEPAPVPAE